MTNERYVYQQDIKERKSAGTGAFHKKNGSKSKKVTFPSDYMTNKERKAMNSSVTTYNLNRPIKVLGVFRSMPIDIQQEYLQKLEDRFHPTFQDIASMFGVSDQTLRFYFRQDGIKWDAHRGRKSVADTDEWKEFLKDQETQYTEKEPDTKQEVKYTNMQITFQMDGFDTGLFEELKRIYKNKKVKISVLIDVLDD